MPVQKPATNNNRRGINTNNEQHSHQRLKKLQKSVSNWVEDTSDEKFSDYGYNSSECNMEGFSRSGFNKYGLMQRDYGPDGFNAFGFDREGYNREGRNIMGLTRADYDADGYDAYGLDCYGYDSEGFNCYGYSKKDYDVNGMDKHGYTSDGLYHGVPGTSHIPLRYAKVLRGRSDPKYARKLYGTLQGDVATLVKSAKKERVMFIEYKDLTTNLNLSWTGWMSLKSLDLC